METLFRIKFKDGKQKLIFASQIESIETVKFANNDGDYLKFVTTVSDAPTFVKVENAQKTIDSICEIASDDLTDVHILTFKEKE